MYNMQELLEMPKNRNFSSFIGTKSGTFNKDNRQKP